MILRTVDDLKRFLQEQLNNLDVYNGDEELNVAHNTYFLTRNGATNILETPKGFIDLDSPVEENNGEEE